MVFRRTSTVSCEASCLYTLWGRLGSSSPGRTLGGPSALGPRDLGEGRGTVGGSRSGAAEDLVHVLVVGWHDPLVLLLEDRRLDGPHLAVVRRALEEHVADGEGGRTLLGLEHAVFVGDADHDGRLGLLGDDQLHVLSVGLPVAQKERGSWVSGRVGFARDHVEAVELVVRVDVGRADRAMPVPAAGFDVDRRAPGGHRDRDRDLTGDDRGPRLREGTAGGPGSELGEVTKIEGHENLLKASNPEGFHRPKVRHGRL